MKTMWRSLALVVLCLFAAQNFALACGGDWASPWRPALFTPLLVVGQVPADGDAADRGRAENIQDWKAVIPGSDAGDVEAFVYHSSLKDLQRLRARYDKGEKPTGITPSGRVEAWIFQTKNVAVLDYLIFAKECEAYRGRVAPSDDSSNGSAGDADDVWAYNKKSAEEGLRLALSAEQRLTVVSMDFLRLRYVFQALRLYHSMHEYARAVNLFRAQAESLMQSPLKTAGWCRAWYAGALYYQRDYAEALRQAALAERQSTAYPMYTTARWAMRQEPGCVEAAVKLCATAQERLDVLSLVCLAEANSGQAVRLLQEAARSGLGVTPQLLKVMAVVTADAQGPDAETTEYSSYKKLDAYLPALEAGFTALRDKAGPYAAQWGLMAANLAFVRDDVPAARDWLMYAKNGGAGKSKAEESGLDGPARLQWFILDLACLAHEPGKGDNDARLASKLQALRSLAGLGAAERPTNLLPDDAALLEAVQKSGTLSSEWQIFTADAGRQILGGILADGAARHGRPYLVPACIQASALFVKKKDDWDELNMYFGDSNREVALWAMRPENTARLRGLYEHPATPLESFLALPADKPSRARLLDIEACQYNTRDNFLAAARLLELEKQGELKSYWGSAPERPLLPAPGTPVFPAEEPWAFGYDITIARENGAATVTNTSSRKEGTIPPRHFDAQLLARPVSLWDIPLPAAYAAAGDTTAPVPPLWELAARPVMPPQGGSADKATSASASANSSEFLALNKKITERCLWLLARYEENPDTRLTAERMLALDWLIKVGDAYDSPLADRARYLRAADLFVLRGWDHNNAHRYYDWGTEKNPPPNPAQEKFLEVAHKTKDRELAARALFMVALCRQVGLFEEIYKEKRYRVDEKIWSDDPYFRDNPPFAELHTKYRDTEFYKNAVNACTYLRDFVSLQK